MSRRNGRAALLACLAVVVGCEAPPDPDHGGVASWEITDGEIDDEHTAVVALTVGGGSFCSGTLITPTVVLTAAHCLPPHAQSVTRYSQIVVVYATNAFGPGLKSNVGSGWTHPEFGTNGLNNDIGLLRLTGPGPVTPIPPALEPPAEGAEVLVVGYGVTTTQGSDSGRRRSGQALVDWVGLGTLTLVPVPSNICFGDSGGPTLMGDGSEERVVGIHSHVLGDCGPVGVDERVDIHAEEIRAFVLEAAPTCAADDGCVPDCAAPDPDCDCGGDGECRGPCPDGEPDPDCPDICEADGICVDTCGATDPDCPCSQDGRCDPACTDDPDCPEPTEPCSEDGFCDQACGDDPDCGGTGSQGGGCSVAAQGGPPLAGGACAWLGLAWTLFRRRRGWPMRRRLTSRPLTPGTSRHTAASR